ncbi:putative quinol monooxygenase [Nocardia sp. alder85J]|uniref:putative quinol monooxygenase n=1 Tax=Nocardia sp. alder85J TaxID=2862949 RepID=UPI001CD67FA3|nr:antibiotic biosynthesis monooxygenase [Nocardia sp. alder85J]MCX4095568.1 antibiotic biosynthesis monooxygenase [Nocardia sp. alder85J]
MAVQVAIDMTVKAGRYEELHRWILEHLAGTRGFEGNISVEVTRNQDEPNRILFVEKWVARENFENYLAWREETGVIAELAEMLDGDVGFRYHDFMGV